MASPGPLNIDHIVESQASFRNILRLKDSFLIAQAISDFPIGRNLRPTSREINVCCPLPFPLQDLCLLVIICDLDCHRTDVLSSLPRWFRQRLLNALPALDLGRLEGTPVANGIDVDAIWKSRCQNHGPSKQTVVGLPHPGSYSNLSMLLPSLGGASLNSPSTAVTFQMNICKATAGLSTHSSHKKILEEEVKSALKNISQEKFPEGKDSLLTMASDIITSVPKIDLTAMIHKLISINGELVFPNLLSGSMHQKCRQPSLCRQGVWKKQACGLGVNLKFDHDCKQNPLGIACSRPRLFSVGLENKGILLTPHRSLPIMYHFDPLEVLSLLSRDCSLQPASVFVHIDSISETFLNEVCSEMLAQDCGTIAASDRPSCISTINNLLAKVAVLRLRCDSYSYIEIMKGMIDAAAAHYQLKLLFCTLPNLYVDLVKPLSNLFSFQNFFQLIIEVDEMHNLMLSRLLKEFMAISCRRVHKLTILVKKGIVLPTLLKENQLPIQNRGEPQTASTACSAENKVLQFASKKELTQSLYLILQLPVIRLKEIALVDIKDHYGYVHLCAIHPDLQTTKLTVDLSEIDVISYLHSQTFQTDIVALFGIPSLQKIAVIGNWGKHEGIKLGLIQGLLSRSRSLPLKKLALELECNNSYKMVDFQALCNAIFSLPQLENLKLVLGKGFADMLRQPGYEKTLYRSWSRKGLKVQLKSICLQTYRTTYDRLSLVTQKVMFAIKEKKYQTAQRHMDLDFDSFYWHWSGIMDNDDYRDDDYDDYYGDDYYDDY